MSETPPPVTCSISSAVSFLSSFFSFIFLNIDPDNINYEEDGPLNMVKPGREDDFAKRIADLLHDSGGIFYEDWAPIWYIPFRVAFERIAENSEDCFAYYEDGEITPELMKQWREDNGL